MAILYLHHLGNNYYKFKYYVVVCICSIVRYQKDGFVLFQLGIYENLKLSSLGGLKYICDGTWEKSNS